MEPDFGATAVTDGGTTTADRGVIVVGAGGAVASSPTAGSRRAVAIAAGDALLVRETIDGDAATDWHTHVREAYGAVLDGRLRVEYDDEGGGDGEEDGDDERLAVEVERDGYVRIPAGLRHREVAPDGPVELLVAYVPDRPTSTTAPDPAVPRPESDRPQIQVVDESALVPADELAGLTRLTPFPDAPVRLIRGHADGRVTSPWHHHGDNDVLGHVLAGSGYTEWGPDAEDRVLARASDSFLIPAGVVHRDRNPDDDPQEYLVWLLGSTPRTIPVDGPGLVADDRRVDDDGPDDRRVDESEG